MEDFSPYQRFTRSDWAALRADTPLTLDEVELKELPRDPEWSPESGFGCGW